MLTVNMHDAKSQLSKLLDAAESGEEVIIARNGMPAVRLVPVVTHDVSKRIGGGRAILGGLANMSLEEFNASDAEIAADFHNSIFPDRKAD
jgi:prevent-host-death family protein